MLTTLTGIESLPIGMLICAIAKLAAMLVAMVVIHVWSAAEHQLVNRGVLQSTKIRASEN